MWHCTRIIDKYAPPPASVLPIIDSVAQCHVIGHWVQQTTKGSAHRAVAQRYVNCALTLTAYTYCIALAEVFSARSYPILAPTLGETAAYLPHWPETSDVVPEGEHVADVPPVHHCHQSLSAHLLQKKKAQQKPKTRTSYGMVWYGVV